MNNTDIATRITQIESRLQELKSIGTPGNFGAGGVLFGGTNGKAAVDATNLVWDNTNKRLGIGTNAPAANAKLHVKFTGGGVTGIRVEQVSASGDTLLDLFNSDHTIASGSNLLLARSDTVTYGQFRGDGFFGIYGPVQIRDTTFAVPTKTHLHVSSQSRYGIRVAASTAGGMMIQDILTTNSGFARGFIGHNAIWNDVDSLWYIDNIGANDAAGFWFGNASPIQLIMAPTSGASSRTMNDATFRSNIVHQWAIANGQATVVNSALTNTQVNHFASYHRTSGTPAVGFGGQYQMLGDTNGGSDRAMAMWRAQWEDATDGTRKAFSLHYVADTTYREYMRGGTSGTAAEIGFLGAGAVGRQSIGAAAPAGGTGATAGAYDTAAHRDALITLANNIRTALINLGLCQT